MGNGESTCGAREEGPIREVSLLEQGQEAEHGICLCWSLLHALARHASCEIGLGRLTS